MENQPKKVAPSSQKQESQAQTLSERKEKVQSGGHLVGDQEGTTGKAEKIVAPGTGTNKLTEEVAR